MTRYGSLAAGLTIAIACAVLAYAPDDWGIPLPLRLVAMFLALTAGWWCAVRRSLP